MVEKVEIKNFKILKSLSLDKLDQITLVSGKNNVGKSTLLEALFFTNFYYNADSFVNINNIRGAINILKTDVWKSFINIYSTDKSFEINKLENGRNIRVNVRLEDDSNVLSRSFSENNIVSTAQRPGTTNDNRNVTHRLSISANDGEISDLLEYNVSFDGRIEPSDHSPSNPLRRCTHTQYISSKSLYNQAALAEMVGQLELNGKSGYLLEALRILSPKIVGIKTLVNNSVVKIYVTYDDGRNMPIDYMGDGICRLACICTSILSTPNGLVLVDEIENGFHYSMHRKIWEAIYKAAKLSNVQVIATSHSYECIKSASEAIGECPDFGYIRLDEVAGEIVGTSFDSKELKAAFEMNMEIR